MISELSVQYYEEHSRLYPQSCYLRVKVDKYNMQTHPSHVTEFSWKTKHISSNPGST